MQLIVALYQLVGQDVEGLFSIIFSLCLSLCGAAFPNSVLKDSVTILSLLMGSRPAFFKAAIATLDSREIKYLQLLMTLHASNQIQ